MDFCGVYFNWLGSCDFYIAFNVDKAKFYRIGGFDILDLSDFFDDLGPKDLDLFDLGSDKALDFYCLKSHSELPKMGVSTCTLGYSTHVLVCRPSIRPPTKRVPFRNKSNQGTGKILSRSV